MRVPVRPINTIYAHFKHIRGIPSSEGGVPIFKLRILDTLIDNLLSLREKVPESYELIRLESENIDSLIHELQQRLQDRIISTKALFGGFFPETGLLIDLVA